MGPGTERPAKPLARGAGPAVPESARTTPATKHAGALRPVAGRTRLCGAAAVAVLLLAAAARGRIRQAASSARRTGTADSGARAAGAAQPAGARGRVRLAVSSARTRLQGIALIAAIAALLLASAAPAQAAGYRYWSYWLRSGDTWTYAQTGPAMHVPKDGSVEGWRFAVSADAAAKAVQPRGAADFAAICAATPAVSGKKRIALVLDPGTPADAPGGAAPPAPRTACAQIPRDASSADALAAVAKPLRYDSAGILCAITGYPPAGCGDQVAASTGGSHPTAPSGSNGGPSVGLYAGAAAILALAAAGVWQARRRRS